MRSMVDSLQLCRGFLTCAAGEIDKPRCVTYFSTTPKVRIMVREVKWASKEYANGKKILYR